MTANERLKTLTATINTVKKQFGEGAIMRLGSEAPQLVAVIPTGSIGLDRALGVGGLPRGRIIELFGHESSGKTTLSLHAIAETQRQGGVALFVDAEHGLDLNYAKKLGVRVDELLVSQPDTGDQALEIIENVVRSGAIDLVVVDSVAALVPKAEVEGQMGDEFSGMQARLMSQAMRKLAGVTSRSGTTVLFINQVRQRIGVIFGNPETTTGGSALKFYASVRMEIRRTGNIKDGDIVIGSRTKVKVVKNKLAPPFTEAEFDVLYDKGIAREAEALDLAVAASVVEKVGTHYSLDGERLGTGRERVVEHLRQNPRLLEVLQQRLQPSR